MLPARLSQILDNCYVNESGRSNITEMSLRNWLIFYDFQMFTNQVILCLTKVSMLPNGLRQKTGNKSPEVCTPHVVCFSLMYNA